MRFADAIDLYIGHKARAGLRPSSQASYFRLLCDMADQAGRHRDVSTLELADYERFLNRWVGKSPSTLASGVSLVRGFSRFLYDRGLTPADIADPLKRPRRHRPEDLDVVTVDEREAVRMLNACEKPQELLCLATALFVGARRAALASARRDDVDLVDGTIRFREKGGKVITKQIPDEYRELLTALDEQGFWKDGRDYLIPNRRPNAVRRVERSDKVVWETVRTVAKRAGVNSHVHALRAAFAVRFLEQHPDRIYALKELMGHTRIETTTVYLRRMNRAQEMEAVRDLTWNVGLRKIGAGQAETSDPLAADRGAVSPGPDSGFESSPAKAHTGFEPVFVEKPVTGLLLRKLAELRAHQRSRETL